MTGYSRVCQVKSSSQGASNFGMVPGFGDSGSGQMLPNHFPMVGWSIIWVRTSEHNTAQYPVNQWIVVGESVVSKGY